MTTPTWTRPRQTCVCANRLLVQEGVYDAFAAKLGKAVDGLKVGNGLQASITQGPLIDMKALEKVEEHIADAVSACARVVVGGHRHALGLTFFEPTILADVTSAMMCAREETFGPVAPLFRFKTEAEAISTRQRHRVRPRQLLLRPRHWARLASRRGARLRNGGGQHRPNFH